jgi:hypothetical protein
MPQVYKTLNIQERQIRLVLLDGSKSWDEPITCGLHVVSLSTKPEYKALSYVWGDAEDKLPILVCGEELMVTRNLEAGLRHMRFHGHQTLWIDAICINQDDLDERREQVGIMKDIYATTPSVLV